jgi:hypothetical protein
VNYTLVAVVYVLQYVSQNIRCHSLRWIELLSLYCTVFAKLRMRTNAAPGYYTTGSEPLYNVNAGGLSAKPVLVSGREARLADSTSAGNMTSREKPLARGPD